MARVRIRFSEEVFVKKNLVVLVVIAFAVAAVCTGLLYFLVIGRVQDPGPAANSAQILVAARKLAPGSPVRKEDVRSVAWKGSELPSGLIPFSEDVAKYVVAYEIAEGEPLTKGKLTSPLTGEGAGLGIPVGFRAVSVRVFDSPGVVNILQPGHTVDLQSVDAARGESKTFLSRVTVLKLQQPREGSNQSNAAILTLLVKPEEADQVSLTDANQRVRILLRNPTENAAPMNAGVLSNRQPAGTPGAVAKVVPTASR